MPVRDLRKLTESEVANRTIIPFYRNGVLRVGLEDIPLNRAFQRFGHGGGSQAPNIGSQFENRFMNSGGVSDKLFGKRAKIS